jgi:hypothetical protein
MKIQFIRDIWESEDFYRILAVAPVFSFLGALLLYSGLMSFIPEKGDLVPMDGEATDLKNSSAKVTRDSVNEKLAFPCICDYGWGYKAFDNPVVYQALVFIDDKGAMNAWGLKLNDRKIFSYEDIAPGKKAKREEEILLGGVVFAVSIIMSFLYLHKWRLRRLGNNDLVQEQA